MGRTSFLADVQRLSVLEVVVEAGVAPSASAFLVADVIQTSQLVSHP